MAEGNGGGRLDRLEALLERMGEKLDKIATMGYLHDDRLSRIEIGIEEMREEEAEYRKQQRERDKVIDDRIDKLVSAMGAYVSGRRPA